MMAIVDVVVPVVITAIATAVVSVSTLLSAPPGRVRVVGAARFGPVSARPGSARPPVPPRKS